MTLTQPDFTCRLRLWTGTLLCLFTLLGSLPAQQPDSQLPRPRINTLFPSGGKVGTTVEVKLDGTDLENPERMIFSHPEIKAEAIIPPAPPVDPKKPPMPPPPKPPVTSFKVTIPATVPPGLYDARVLNRWGISNPRVFAVGDLNEVLEKEPNNDVPQAERIVVNSTVNGNMANKVDVDYFLFTGKKGQRILLSCRATSIDSLLFPNVEVYDQKNRLLTQNRGYHFQDALCELRVPEDGDYLVRLSQFTHLVGDARYFYRLSVTTGPWIDSIYPPVVEPGKPTLVTIYGRNLPGGQVDPTMEIDGMPLEKLAVTITPPAKERATGITFSGMVSASMSGLDGFEYTLRSPIGLSNPVFIGFAQHAIVTETQSNDSAETAQVITAPCEIAGRIEKRTDRDWFVFQGKKGDTLTFDLLGDRLGHGGDLYFVLRNAANKGVIVEQDDTPGEVNNTFYARTDDPAPFIFSVPADGQYQLMISSRTGGSVFGPRNAYRMRIRPAAPDFRLVVLGGPDKYRPSGATISQGGNEMLRVLVWREDGFTGEIELVAEGLPQGVTFTPQVIGPRVTYGRISLSATADAPRNLSEIRIKGKAIIKGAPIVREARPGTLVWTNNPNPGIPQMGRLARNLLLNVAEKGPWGLTATIDKAEIDHNTPANITVKANRNWPEANQPIQIIAQEDNNPQPLPQNLNFPQVNINQGQAEAKIGFTVNQNTPPGKYSVVFRSQSPVNNFTKDKADPKAPKQNITVVEYAPPITFTVFPKTLASVSVSVPQGNVKVGMQTEVIVQVNRQFNYEDEFKVQLILPPNMQGLSAGEVTIPAGQNQAKLIVKADAGAAPGGRNGLIARVRTPFAGRMIVQEAQFNLNIVK